MIAEPRMPTGFFSNLSREHDFEPVAVEGVLPPTLRGTLYTNGPGIFEQFGRRYDHVFEGDGAITAVRFRGGQALAAARVIESAGLMAERAAGCCLDEPKNTANTHVVAWQGGLYALNEGGKPTRIDPDSLETLGETDLNGVVVSAFSAHPHRVVGHNTPFNFGMFSGNNPVWRYTPYPTKVRLGC